MALTNAQVTECIEEMSDKFKQFQKDYTKKIPDISPLEIVNQLLWTSHYPLTLRQLNQNYQTMIGHHGYLITPPTSEAAQQKLLSVAQIHLKAIAEGYLATKVASEQKAIQQSTAEAHAATQRAKVIHHVHHNATRDDNFWFWLYILDRPSHNRTPTNPSQQKHDNNQDPSSLGILLAITLLIAAGGTLGYSVMQTYHRIEEILHGEDMLANTTKLSVTAFAAWQGYMLGISLGATYLANPLLGAICTAIIASAAGMKLSKWGAELAHQSTNTTSALAYDPRFCLTDNERYALIGKGYNPQMVEEAIRVIAIQIKKTPANGLKFWDNPHKPLIDLVRQLKQGYGYEILNFEGKCFDLMRRTAQAEVCAPPLYNVQPTKPIFYSDSPPYAQPVSEGKTLATAVPPPQYYPEAPSNQSPYDIDAEKASAPTGYAL